MRRAWRLLLLAAAALLVTGVLLLGLAVMTVFALPVALALQLAVLALVAGFGTHLRRGARRRRRAGGKAAQRADEPDTSVPEPGAPSSGPRWTTGWESELSTDAVPLTRDRLRTVLADWGVIDEASEPILLVATELLSNVIDHGRGPARLSVEFFDAWVRVEVHDGSPEPPLLLPPDPLRVRGRGMQLVDALSARWGWTDAPPGKAVWADVPTAWPA